MPDVILFDDHVEPVVAPAPASKKAPARKPVAKKATTKAKAKKLASSRSPEARRARRVIRDYLRAATFFSFVVTTDGKKSEAYVDAAAALDRASSLLSTLPGYADDNYND